MHRHRRKREHNDRHSLPYRSRCRTQPRERPNMVTVAVLMAGTEVTACGCVEIGTTPEVHVAVISNEGGTGETAMETSPGMRLPEATLATDRRGSSGRRTGGSSTNRMSGEASRLRTTCRLSRDTGSGGKSTSERT